MKRIVLSMLCLYLSFQSFAQSDSSTVMNEVVITANRFPQKQNNTGKVLTVIPRSVIDRSGGQTLGELLNQQGGIMIVGANNNLGTNQDVYVRGASTGNTLILIDGVPAYDPSTIGSTFDINQMPLDQIERIEILRGAQSTTYGSDAVAGVINLITKRAANKPVEAYGTLAYGSFQTFRGLAGLRGKSGETGYQLQYQRLSSSGFSAAHDSTGNARYDKDGFSQDVVNAAVQTKISKGLSWHANAQWGRYRTDLDAAAFTDEKDNTADNRNLQFGTGLSYRSGSLAVHANYNGNISERNYLNDSTDKAGFSDFSREKYTGKANFAELYASWQANSHWRFLAGTDYRWQQTDQSFYSVSAFGPYESSLSADSAKMRIYSLYGSAFLDTKKGFFLEAGGRYNRHNRFGDAFTFSLNPSYLLQDRWKFFINIASAFKAPSLYQLFDASVGTRNLEAERSLTEEIGVQFLEPSGAVNIRLTAFARQVRDGIDFSYVDFRYFNNNEQQDRGFELEANYRKGKWTLLANYAYVTGEVNTTRYVYDPGSFTYIPNGDTTYNNLFRRPKHLVNLSAGFQFNDKGFVRVSARLAGKRFEPRFMDAPLELDAYQVFDLYTEYRVWKKQVVFVELKNLFDATYFDVAGFNTRSRNVMAGLRFAF